MKHYLVILLLILMYFGSYLLFRSNELLYVQFQEKKCTITVDISNDYGQKLVTAMYLPVSWIEAHHITKHNPGSQDLGPHRVLPLAYRGMTIGIHQGNPDIANEEYLLNYTWGDYYGCWNVSPEDVARAMNKLLSIERFKDIKYRKNIPSFSRQFDYFKSKIRNGDWWIQAIGTYNQKSKRIFFNLGNNEIFYSPAGNKSLSSEFRRVHDGGADFVRFEYDMTSGDIYHFDPNGP